MARYDDDNDIHTPRIEKHPDKPKGQMSIREAAAMEMPQQLMETGMRGMPVHGFGNGTETVKRHTGMGPDMTMGMTPDMGMTQASAGESVTTIIEQVFELPFHAQLSVMRMIASRVLGMMDARDREKLLNELRMMDPHGEDTGVETSEARMTDTPDIQGT